MNKIRLFLLALCAVTLVSCGGSEYAKAIDVIEDAISDINKAKTKEKVYEIRKAARKESQDLILQAASKGIRASEKESSKLWDVEREFNETLNTKLREF